MMASWIPASFLKTLFSSSLTANFSKILSFENYYIYGGTSLFTFYTTLCSWYDYTWLQHGRTIISMVEHSVTGTNYCKALI